MGRRGFHDEAYDAGTLSKLRIFELYAQEWIPVFAARPEPPFREIHLFDFFCGPGTDARGEPGSPLRMLRQLRAYAAQGLAGWPKLDIRAHFSDRDRSKTDELAQILQAEAWQIPNVRVEVQPLDFENALRVAAPILRDAGIPKLLIIDQFGVDAVNDEVFARLCRYPRTDFIFFISSSTLHRFRNQDAIKIKIEEIDTSYDVHRAACAYFTKLAPPGVFLGRFSLKKRGNIYGLIFGSRHPLGICKFLEVAWACDEIAGEANFDIERENVAPNEMLLPFDELKPKKLQVFQEEFENEMRAGRCLSEMDVIHRCIAAGMTPQHASVVLKKLKRERVIECDFHTPNIRNWNAPRPIRFLGGSSRV